MTKRDIIPVGRIVYYEGDAVRLVPAQCQVVAPS